MRSIVLAVLLVVTVSCCASAVELSAESVAAYRFRSAVESVPRGGTYAESRAMHIGVVNDYHGTEAAQLAQMRAASCLYQMKSYNEAISECSAVIQAYPGTLAAAWSQMYKAASLAKLAQYAQATQAFYAVERYSVLADHAPILNSRHYAATMLRKVEKEQGATALTVMGVDKEDRDFVAWIRMLRIIESARRKEWAQATDLFNAYQLDYPDYVDYSAAAALEIGHHLYEYYASGAQTSQDIVAVEYIRYAENAAKAPFIKAKAGLYAGRYYAYLTKDYTSAKSSFLSALSVSPSCGLLHEIRFQYASVLMLARDNSAAAAEFDKVALEDKLSGWCEAAAFMKAECVSSAGNIEDAKTYFADAMSSDSIHESWRNQACLELASLHLKTQDYAAGVALIQGYISRLQDALLQAESNNDIEKIESISAEIASETARLSRLSSQVGGDR